MAEADVFGASRHDAPPGNVLFACTMNSVRSPIATGILRYLAGPRLHVDSVGVHAGLPDPLVTKVMDEIGIDVSHYRSKAFERIAGETFDLIVTLSPEAHHKALDYAREMTTKVEYWPTMDATVTAEHASETEQELAAYRQVRDQLFMRIKTRFKLEGGPTV